MNGFRNGLVVGMLALLCLTTSVVRAQGVQEQVEQLNREAMEAYNNLDINTAGRKLEEALRLAQEGGLGGLPVAITNLNMGMVYIGGLGDQPGGTSFFVAAICQDAGIQLDPLVSTPEMQAAFSQAQVQAQQSGCAAGAASAGTSGGGVMMPVQPPPVTPLVHVPPAEQHSQTPLPLYVEVSSAIGAERVFLHYKGLGMDAFKKVPMYSFGQGMAYQIPCNDVWEPKVSYYLEAVASDGRVVGSVGSQAVPIEVAVVGTAPSVPPALPGRSAPQSCAAGECPPGVACDKPGTLGIGEECSSDSGCENGLICGSEDVCKLDGAGGTTLGAWSEEETDDGGDAEFSRAFVQLGFTLGFAFLSEGMPVDRLPPNDRVFVNDATGMYTGTPGPGDTLVLPFPDEQLAYPELVNEWVPDADSSDSVGPYGGSCSPDGTATGPMSATLYPSSYCARLASSGFSANAALRANVGYFITDRIAASVVWRLQFDSGVGTLASMLFGARGEYLLTEQVTEGLMLSAFGGLTFGQIQGNPGYDGGSDTSPYIKSGLFGIHVGANVRYRFHRNFGVYAGPEIDLQFPDFLFNIDIPIGVEVAFL